MQHETSAGAILFRRDKKSLFLLLHYQSGHWDFPKGHVEKGENHEQTVHREVDEETGITEMTILPGFTEKIHYFYMQDGKKISKHVFYYVAETVEKKVALSYEHIGFEWLPYEKAFERLTFKNAKDMLEKAWKFLSRE